MVSDPLSYFVVGPCIMNVIMSGILLEIAQLLVHKIIGVIIVLEVHIRSSKIHYFLAVVLWPVIQGHSVSHKGYIRVVHR